MGRLHTDDRASSHSLHSLEEDDLPPPYTDEDIPPVSTSAPGVNPLPIHLRLVDSAYILPDSGHKTDLKRTISLAPSLSVNSDELFYTIRRQLKLPPRPLLYIRGSHTESTNDGKKKGNNSVTDFEFKLDLAETMLTGWEGEGVMNFNWVEEQVISDWDCQPAYRGGRAKSRTYKAPLSRVPRSEDSDALLASDEALGVDDANEQPVSANEAHLKLWCERFCNDPSSIKSCALLLLNPRNSQLTNRAVHLYRFTIHRKTDGFDWKAMRNVLDSHIRSLNYRGSIYFNYLVAEQSVTIYSPHWINRMRANRYIWWIFIVLQLWIITWPIIWFLESGYEPGRTCWHASLDTASDSGLVRDYACGRDEVTLGEFWAPAVKRMAWSRRRGQADTLTRMDAERVQGLTTEQLLGLQDRGGSVAERERRERVNRGDGGFVDHVVGLVRGIGEAGQDWRLSMGWGANS